MGYSDHKFKFSDVDCLVVLNSLDMLIADNKHHPVDKQIARELRDNILNTINTDKKLKMSNPTTPYKKETNVNEYYTIRDMIKDIEISQFSACDELDDSFKHFLSIPDVISTAYSLNKITKLDREDLIAIWRDKFHKIIDAVVDEL